MRKKVVIGLCAIAVIGVFGIEMFVLDNTIGIIGDTYYILDIDHYGHKEVLAEKIPVMETDTCINAVEVLCAERTADVDDWVLYDR